MVVGKIGKFSIFPVMLKHPIRQKVVCRFMVRKKRSSDNCEKTLCPAVTPGACAERDDDWERLSLNITRQVSFWKQRRVPRARCWKSVAL